METTQSSQQGARSVPRGGACRRPLGRRLGGRKIVEIAAISEWPPFVAGSFQLDHQHDMSLFGANETACLTSNWSNSGCGTGSLKRSPWNSEHPLNVRTLSTSASSPSVMASRPSNSDLLITIEIMASSAELFGTSLMKGCANFDCLSGNFKRQRGRSISRLHLIARKRKLWLQVIDCDNLDCHQFQLDTLVVGNGHGKFSGANLPHRGAMQDLS